MIILKTRSLAKSTVNGNVAGERAKKDSEKHKMTEKGKNISFY